MIYFTADTHFNHANIIKHCNRCFKNVSEMNEGLINNWNERITNDDEVYHLGDFGYGSNIYDIINRLNFKKLNLILGNHDDYDSFLELIMHNKPGKVFSVYQGYKDIKIEKQHITLCHYSMRTWYKSHKNAWQLFGHSHGKLPDIGLKQMDVGVDANLYYPLSFEEIKEKLS